MAARQQQLAAAGGWLKVGSIRSACLFEEDGHLADAPDVLGAVLRAAGQYRGGTALAAAGGRLGVWQASTAETCWVCGDNCSAASVVSTVPLGLWSQRLCSPT